jgi:DNA-directed RNA polymerase specialized sigma24 family protein
MPMDDANAPILPDDVKSSHFEGLLRRLDPDRERAGELYEALRRKLIKFFEWNSCFPAEDLADETLDRVAQKLEEEFVHDVPAFASGVAKRVRQEAQKRDLRMVRVPDVAREERFFRDPRNPEREVQDKMDGERRAKCLHICVQRLSDKDRELFFRYYNTTGERIQYRLTLAQTMGLAIGALRVRVNRLRDELERCARKCAASPRGGLRRIDRFDRGERR